ncbi:MAG: hypothetical protein KC478_07015 [Bacteriovoracaceae bacterium]|nr:hypothetical protein [Bacteriovoracaceae bacterium]
MKKLILFVFLIFASRSFVANACDENGNSGYLPENDMYISVDDKMAGDMTEARFNEIIDKIAAVYEPIVRSKRGKLKVNRKWKDGTVNASAQRSGKTWIVNMYGGLARHADVTDDGFAMVVCHELGHHLGGAPKVGSFFNKWASNEGQSDYYGSSKCFRRVYANDDNVAIVAAMEVPEFATKNCMKAWSTQDDIALCQRAAMAGKSLSKLLARSGTPKFSTPDSSVVTRTNHRHPAGQCRLDTYFQGALCEKDVTDEVDNRDAKKGVCNRSTGQKIGNRPLCWYKP